MFITNKYLETLKKKKKKGRKSENSKLFFYVTIEFI